MGSLVLFVTPVHNKAKIFCDRISIFHQNVSDLFIIGMIEIVLHKNSNTTLKKCWSHCYVACLLFYWFQTVHIATSSQRQSLKKYWQSYEFIFSYVRLGSQLCRWEKLQNTLISEPEITTVFKSLGNFEIGSWNTFLLKKNKK